MIARNLTSVEHRVPPHPVAGDLWQGTVTCIDADFATFRLTGKSCKPFPTTHFPDAFNRQVGKPVIYPGMVFAAMLMLVVIEQVIQEPLVSFCFIIRLMEMVQNFVSFLNCSEGAFHFALGPGGHTPTVFAGGDMGLPIYVKTVHDVLEDPAFSNWAVVEINHLWPPAKRETINIFGRHGIEEKTQRGFDVFTIDAAVLLVANSTPVIDHAEKHQ